MPGLGTARNRRGQWVTTHAARLAVFFGESGGQGEASDKCLPSLPVSLAPLDTRRIGPLDVRHTLGLFDRLVRQAVRGRCQNEAHADMRLLLCRR
jgi:hypothetical protein